MEVATSYCTSFLNFATSPSPKVCRRAGTEKANPPMRPCKLDQITRPHGRHWFQLIFARRNFLKSSGLASQNHSCLYPKSPSTKDGRHCSAPCPNFHSSGCDWWYTRGRRFGQLSWPMVSTMLTCQTSASSDEQILIGSFSFSTLCESIFVMI